MLISAKHTNTVTGMALTQYTQNSRCIWTGSEGTVNRAGKKVSGRKAMVMTAMTFVDELSFLKKKRKKKRVRDLLCK